VTDRVDQIVLDLQNIPPQEWTQVVVSDLTAMSEDTGVFLGFANAQGDLDIDDVVLVPNQQ
jgi:hypothetical protein